MLNLPDGVDSPVLVEVAYGADLTAVPATWPWRDYTIDVRGAVPVRQGRRPGAQRAEPAYCPLRLDSPDGRHHPLLPTGPNYPNVGRNTPVRVRLHPNVAGYATVTTDAFDRTVVDGWGSTDTGLVWSLSGTAADFDVAGGVGTMALTGDPADRRVFLEDLDVVDQDVTATVSVAMPTGAGISVWLMLRKSDINTYYGCRAAIATSGAISAVVFRAVSGPDTTLASASTSLTHAGGTPLHLRAQAYDNVVRLKVWQGSTEPANWLIETTDSDPHVGTQAGLMSVVDAGNSNAEPLVFTWSNVIIGEMPVRFGGYADGFRPDWRDGTSDGTTEVAVDAYGILRRLSRRSKPLRSPIYREIMSAANDPYRVAYWPVEDGTRAARAASPMTGVAAMTVAGSVSFGAYTTAPGSAPFAVLGAGGSLVGTVPTYTSTQHKTVSVWALPQAGLTDLTVMQRLYGSGGTVDRWDLIYSTASSGSIKLVAYSSAGAVIDSIGLAGSNLNGKHFLTSVEQQTNGSDLDVLLLYQLIDVDNPSDSVLFADTFTAVTMGRVATVTIAPNGDCTDLAVGHIGVSSLRGALATLGGSRPAVIGYAGETAVDRFARLCTEERILATVAPGVHDAVTTTMGPQSTSALLDLLEECETTDVGVIDEEPFGLRYVARGARYNQPVALALDTAAGTVALPFQPAYDDLDLRNDVEATRPDGSSGWAVATGTLAPDSTIGRYDLPVRVNTETDEPLDDIAAWLVHTGTVDEYRVPALRVDLAVHEGLIPGWLTAKVGARVTASLQLTQYPPGPVDQLLDGYTERFDAGPVWLVDLSGSPASPWQVAVVEGAGSPTEPPWRLDTGGSELAAGISSSATSLSVATTGVKLWTTTATFPADFPFDIDVGGEQITVTAIVGGSSPQTFTVTRSVNGVVKSYLAGAAVQLYRPAVVAL